MPVGEIVDVSLQDGVAILTIDSPPVNALSTPVRAGIIDAVTALAAQDSVEAIVLICAGRTFFAGADIKEFSSVPEAPSFADTVTALENSAKMVVAAIHGSALGAGLELALACDYRLAASTAVCGLPEVTLGLIPGAGGTQRLPRLIGFDAALDIITSGRKVSATEAEALGLFDGLSSENTLRADAVAFARRLIADHRPRRRIRDLVTAVDQAQQHPPDFDGFLSGLGRHQRGLVAPRYCVQAVQAVVRMSFDEGLAYERSLFEQLRHSDQAKALRHAFFAERRVSVVPGLSSTEVLPVHRVGVIGAGTMGSGIAMVFANAGIAVRIGELSREALDRGLAGVSANYQRSLQRGSITEEQLHERIGLIQDTTDLDTFADCDLVIEAVFERLDVKREVFARLDSIVGQQAILASNTSALNLDVIAAATARPERVIGLHFFSPANVMKLLEIVRGAQTAPRVLATALQLARRVGKIGVVVGVGPGFVGNRMLFQRSAMADRLLLAGVLPWDIDRAMVEFGFPMGPFQMSDLIGLDVLWKKETSSGATIREVLCEEGRFGQKTGNGFYDYPDGRTATPSDFSRLAVQRLAALSGVEQREYTNDEICQRLLYPIINEGAKILDEGLALRASDIDVVWLAGYGFPRLRGGPMFHADTVGLATVVQTLRAQQENGFAISPLLERLASQGESFQSWDQSRVGQSNL